MRRMKEERLPQNILGWCPPGRRGKGRPQNSEMQEVTSGTRERGINNMEWIDREEWRRKIKHKSQKDVKTSILCTSHWCLVKD